MSEKRERKKDIYIYIFPRPAISFGIITGICPRGMSIITGGVERLFFGLISLIFRRLKFVSR